MEMFTFVTATAISVDGVRSGSCIVTPDSDYGEGAKTLEDATKRAREQAIDLFESDIGDRAAIFHLMIEKVEIPMPKPVETAVSITLPVPGTSESNVAVTIS